MCMRVSLCVSVCEYACICVCLTVFVCVFDCVCLSVEGTCVCVFVSCVKMRIRSLTKPMTGCIWPPLRNALSDHVYIAQVPVEVLPQVQPELPQECRQPAGYAPLPGG